MLSICYDAAIMERTYNLVLSGGGVKGIALVGAIATLQEHGYRFRRIAGTSAGAVVGGLLASGYSGSDLRDIMHQVPYDRFQDPSWLARLGAPGKIAALYLRKGLYRGEWFCQWYGDLLQQQHVQTFDDLQRGYDYPDGQPYTFIALAANISRGRLFHFPRDVGNYNMDPGRQSIAQAVRASLSLPAFYQPVKIGGDYLVDGGILANFPINCFLGDDTPTIGIKLSGQLGEAGREFDIQGPLSYGSAIVRTMIDAQDRIHLNDADALERTIFIDTDDVMATDFDLADEQQCELYEAGRRSADKFLASRRGQTREL